MEIRERYEATVKQEILINQGVKSAVTEAGTR